MSAPVCAFHHATTSTGLIPSQGAMDAGDKRMRSGCEASNVAEERQGTLVNTSLLSLTYAKQLFRNDLFNLQHP